MTFKGERAGVLSETGGGGSVFVYDQGWSQDIACVLPAAEREHRWPLGLHPFFEHLAPEGWLRGRQARAGHVAEEDDFGLLLRYGADCIGAVGLLPDEEVGSAGAARPAAPPEESAVQARRTVSGVQKKLLAFQRDGAFHPSVALDEPATHIAKFNDPDVRTLVQNEDLTLKLAREVLGAGEVTVASIATVRDIGDVALLVQRFDRNGERRFRLEDFAQILSKPRGRDFRGKYDSSYEVAAEVVSRFSARPQLDLVRFYNLLLFNIVVGNADAHLKNFSLLERPEGLRLSPAYDLLNTAVYDQYDALTALSIDGRHWPLETIGADPLRSLGFTIGLKGSAVEHCFAALRRGFGRAATLLACERAALGDFRNRFATVVRSNQERILG
ncbi:MAG TPA: HipA domain-containing protein [Allosphingosinicella sp.]|nr:HipA domain-containing protein [Allosphingosinicella sp.]